MVCIFCRPKVEPPPPPPEPVVEPPAPAPVYANHTFLSNLCVCLKDRCPSHELPSSANKSTDPDSPLSLVFSPAFHHSVVEAPPPPPPAPAPAPPQLPVFDVRHQAEPIEIDITSPPIALTYHDRLSRASFSSRMRTRKQTHDGWSNAGGGDGEASAGRARQVGARA